MPDTTLLLAPFKGLTEKLYRNAVAKHFGGYNQMFAPFVSGTGPERVNPSKLSDVLPKVEMAAPTVPQLLSSDSLEVIQIGKALQQNGYAHVNWNMGCPFSKIASKKRGCGILPFPDELDRMLEQVFKDFPIMLSIKTRLGYYHPEEIIKAIEVFNRYPIHLLIIHARIGTQLYAGEVNLEGFGQCLELSKVPVAYNGDIFHKTRLDFLQDSFPAINTWMLGRGALINPFLASEIKGVVFGEDEKRERIRNFLIEIEQEGSKSKTNTLRFLGYLKAVWFYLAGQFENPAVCLLKIKKSLTVSDYRNAVEYALNQPFASEKDVEKYFRSGVKHLGDEPQI
jgi:tRNA-dihydrouridine synthase